MLKLLGNLISSRRTTHLQTVFALRFGIVIRSSADGREVFAEVAFILALDE